MKGSIQDLFLIMTVLLISGIGIILSDYILTEFESATNTTNPRTSQTMLNQSYIAKGQNAIGVFNGIYIFITIGSFIAIIITAFMIRTHPVFFVVSLLVMIFLVIYGVILTNIFDSVINQSVFVSIANQYPLLIDILRNLPLIGTIMGFILLIIMFGRRSEIRA